MTDRESVKERRTVTDRVGGSEETDRDEMLKESDRDEMSEKSDCDEETTNGRTTTLLETVSGCPTAAEADPGYGSACADCPGDKWCITGCVSGVQKNRAYVP